MAEGIDDVYAVRLRNARELAKRYDTLAEFAAAIGKQPTQVSRFMGRNPTKTIGNKIARDIERAAGRPHGWLDHEHGDIDQSIKAGATFDAEIVSARDRLVKLLSTADEQTLLEIIDQAAPDMTPAGKERLLSIALEYADALLQQRDK